MVAAVLQTLRHEHATLWPVVPAAASRPADLQWGLIYKDSFSKAMVSKKLYI